MTTTAAIKTYSGTDMQANKLAIFAETDQHGRIFYKTEAQNAYGNVAVSFIFADVDEALDEFVKVARAMLDEQKTKLLNAGE